jgi:hypothetical protein
MPSRKNLSDDENLTPKPPGIFNGSWLWGFIFGWIGIILALVSMRFNDNYPIFVFMFLLTYLIIINLSRVFKTFTNSTYGILGLISAIIAVIELIIVIILK